MTDRPELEILPFESAETWEVWLDVNHTSTDGLWIKFAKKSSGIATVTYAEALDIALCYGWIDGQTRKFDDEYYLQRFTPRRKRSKWSKINREKVAKLIEAGRMKPAGLWEIERAKADGRWDAAYDSPSTATVPDDLQRRFDENPEASEFFATLDSRNRYAILYQIQDAKKPETRARRIEKFVAMLNRREKPHP
ncbi:MAG: YdeI/OmpD-associated family protein [Rubrobacter sp.]|nr:YdeI/OmpD-associated family protein [Rubrobacter sp.]